MTSRRVVVYAATGVALTYVAACAVILHAADIDDHARGWYRR